MHMSLNRKHTLLLSIFCTLLFLCTPGHSDEIAADGIAATVGDEIILLSDVHARMEITMQQLAANPARTKPPAPKEVENRALQDLIDDILVKQQAKEMQIETTDQEVDAAITNMAQQNNMDKETFRQALEAQGTSMEQYKVTIRSDLLKFKVMNMRVRSRVNITDDKAREFYNTQVRDVRRSAEFEGAHILLRIPSAARAIEVAKLREKAVALTKRIKEGASFEELAMTESEDTVTAKFGGHLGKRMPGEIPNALDAVFLDMEPGEIVGPIKSSAGFHILKLVSREDIGVKPFSEVKHIIVGQLTQREMERQQELWLKELRKKTFINIRI
ncbi:MAG: peptidylprolyl isomerase [Deltaproteobacteria bacterium]|nr:peptidylprolyl isomerase [Deltaproteobacteria bacterium]MBN2673903.1 peptidylprolyl isomerase [Deltaproteobacteria bacterium]